MKNFITGLFSFILIFSFFSVLTPKVSAEGFIEGAFVTTWDTRNPGISDSNQIKIPTYGNGYNYNID